MLLSASVGIAVSATGYSNADDVLRDAETALHRATLLGGGACEVFDTAALQSSLTGLQLEAEFAGRAQRGEFAVVYQPIVAIASSRIVGFEALLRWHHPVLGMIAPLDFVPLAERSGFIVPLGRWVLRQACTQLTGWQGELPWQRSCGWRSTSHRAARHATLVEDVAAALGESGLQPDRLVLEVTESLAMEDPSAARSVLMELRTLRRARQHRRLRHRTLVAGQPRATPARCAQDGSVVRPRDRGQTRHGEIVAAVLVMARQLGLRVVAEGIENEAQLAAVRSLGCEYGRATFRQADVLSAGQRS